MTLAKPFTVTLISSLLLIIAYTQYYSDLRKNVRPIIPPIIIPDEVIKMGDLGLHSAAASAMWVYTIQHATENADKLPDLIESVNAIDPKFSYPYAFAALTLPAFLIPGFPEKAIEIAEKGIREADTDWRIPYYLATTYHIFLKNREKAAFYFDLAANTRGAPDKIKNLASFYGTAPNIREQTRQIWLSIYEESKDETIKDKAKNHLIHIELLDALDKAIFIYRQNYGKYPTDIEDLVRGRIIKEVPISPLGSKFIIRDGATHAR